MSTSYHLLASLFWLQLSSSFRGNTVCRDWVNESNSWVQVWHLLHDTTIQVLLSVRVQPERALRKIEVGRRRFIVSIWNTLNSSSQVHPCYLRSQACWMSRWLYGMEEMQTKTRFCYVCSSAPKRVHLSCQLAGCGVWCCLYSWARVSLWNHYCCAASAAATRFLS